MPCRGAACAGCGKSFSTVQWRPAAQVGRVREVEQGSALEVGGSGGEAKVYNERHDWGRPGGGDSEGVGSTGVRGGAADTARQG